MKLRLSLTLLVISIFLANIAKAQTDSAHYDLGRIQVNKDFTQSITVKASDIERYQFNYITDALKVYFYGTFTNSSSVVYVIDGNIVNDVNAYSILDVEEITLVQNAIGQVSGASPGQQLVLIKTRRGGAGKQGIVASDQTSLVNARNNNNYKPASNQSGIYDQVYAGAYKNYTNGDIGVSANFLHDVSPQDLSGTYTSSDPFHYSQFRLNAYADAMLWKGTTLSFGANYSPQVNNEAFTLYQAGTFTDVNFNTAMHESQHLSNTNIALRSHIVAGLTNTLSAGYNHYNDFGQDVSNEMVSNQGSNPQSSHTYVEWEQLEHTLMIKDNLVYHLATGNWNIDPSLNFMYRHVRDTLGETETAYQDTVGGRLIFGQSQFATYNLSLLTPSVDVYYKNIFNIQGGFTGILNKENFGPNFPVSRLLPFVSASLNISEWAQLQAVKLRVFASFSRQNEFLDDPFVSLEAFALQGFDNPAGTFSTTSYPIGASNYNTGKAYNNYQAGLLLDLLKNFNLSYNFRENYNWILAEYAIPQGPNGSAVEYFFQDAKGMTQTFALHYNLRIRSFNWMTGLTATTSKLQLVNPDPNNTANTYLATGHHWTGGFTNRLTWHDFFAGLDVLYQLGQRPYSLENWQPTLVGYVPPSNNNSFSLQNLYLGKKLKIDGLKYAEVYLDTRNILQNKSSDITDERRFYGFGFKVSW